MESTGRRREWKGCDGEAGVRNLKGWREEAKGKREGKEEMPIARRDY
jgi:hypothetical protein